MKISIPLLLLAPLALLTTVPHAQQSRNRLAFVNVQQVVGGMAGGGPYVALTKKADADLHAQLSKIQTLTVQMQSNGGASAAERAQLASARQSYSASAQSYGKQITAAFAPLAERVNTAVASAAKAQGVSVVMDKRVAASTSLVIYANTQTTDLTAAVQAKLK